MCSLVHSRECGKATAVSVPSFEADKVHMSRGGVSVTVRVRLGLGLQFVSTHNTGTTRGPRQIARFLYSILDNSPFVR